MINEAVQVITGGREAVVAHVAQHVVGAVDVEFACHQRVQPRQHRGVLAGVQLGRAGGVKHVASDQQRDLRGLAERCSGEALVEHLALHDVRQRVADALVHRNAGTSKQAPCALCRLPVGAEVLLERELEVVAERQVAKVVKQRRQSQPLLHQEHSGAITLILVAAGEKALPSNRPLRVSTEAQRRMTLHKRPTAAQHLCSLAVCRIRQRSLKKSRGEVHRSEAVRHPRDAHLGKHQVRSG
jgi:hypothetical protein